MPRSATKSEKCGFANIVNFWALAFAHSLSAADWKLQNKVKRSCSNWKSDTSD